MYPTNNIKILSLNCDGLIASETKRHALASLNNKYDIILLQETHFKSHTEAQDTLKQFKNKTINTSNLQENNNRERGVATLSNVKLKIITIKRDREGRILSTLYKIHNKYLNIINIYAPNIPLQRQHFLKQLEAYFLNPSQAENIDNLSTDYIIAGDFNFVEDFEIDRIGVSKNKSILVGRHEIQTLKTKHKLIDIFREQNPNTHKFTRHSKRYQTSSRIDRIYISKALEKHTEETQITPYALSDHSIITLNLKLKDDPTPKAENHWHLNTSLLKDELYKQRITDTWKEWQTNKHHFTSLAQWWDRGKIRLKYTSIRYAQQKNSNRHKLKNALQEELEKITHLAEAHSEQHINRCIQIKDLLKNIENNTLEGIKTRSKIQWREEGEKCTKFFSNSEKQKAEKKTMESLITPEGQKVTTQTEIENEQIRFYTDLYKETPTCPNAQHQLLKNMDKKLTTEQQQICEGNLTLDEITKAQKEFKLGKTPGIDGIPIEFYRTFWDLIGQDLLEVANSCFENRLLSPTMRTGVLTLLYKKGDKNQLKNWRPISLLCIDYKIITKTLANRLKKVLPFIINKDQTCGIEGRQIHDNCHFIRDLLDYVNKSKIPGFLLCIDQMKAFDKISWQYLYKTLETFGFGPTFINWVKLLYTDIRSHIKSNGHMSAAFKLEQGVRQGCCLSALLYILVSETLAENIRKNPNIKGIKLPNGTEAKIISYADDNTLPLSTTDSLNPLFDVLHTYEKASGSKINKEKTEGLWIGSNKNRTDKPHNINMKNDKIKIYGIHFGNVNTDSDNWENKIQNIKKTLNLWAQRGLSIQGKITVINTFLTSKIWYASAILPMPEHFIKQLQILFVNFIWKNGKHLLARKYLYQPKSLGGIDLVHIKSKIHTQRIKFFLRYLELEDQKWKTFTDLHIQTLYGASNKENILLENNFQPKNTNNPFYKELFEAWARLYPKLNKTSTKTQRDILHQNIFQNDNIKLPRNFVTKHFIIANITHIKHIFKNGELIEFEDNPNIQHIPDGEEALENIYRNIPRAWKEKLVNTTENTPLNFSTKLKETPINRTVSKQIYCAITTNENLKPPSYPKFRNIFNTEPDWKSIWKNIHNPLIENLTKDLNWKFCNQILATRDKLKIWNITDDNTCLTCNQNIETNIHIFTDCPTAFTLWTQINPLIEQILGRPCKLNLYKICFGISAKNARSKQDKLKIQLANFIIFEARLLLWRNRNMILNEPNKRIATKQLLYTFKSLIKSRLRQEKEKSNLSPQNLQAFIKTWCISDVLCNARSFEINPNFLIFNL